ncbi:MAG TPA: TIGR02206 family membrane protein [Verrucomicrobiales bacterium]|nr:TIGR02206 family membrane protein [Verrucomicrobiales bacterium]|tara:strand:- start:3552 stop:4253 length:702 start_codon:yes stop_codon:yes gene_type:complete
MLIANFQTGSATHLITLAVIAVLTATLTMVARQARSTPGRALLRNLIGWGSLAAGILNTVYWTLPSRFDPSQSLPLHFCNLATFIGALAVLRNSRLLKGVLYFWSGLCVWAFLTPTIDSGLWEPGFWIFWLYHSFILFTLVVVLLIDKFRPTLQDLLNSATFSLRLVVCLFILNATTGWNYGFLGDDVPGAPTPVALLGGYPLRILWMILLGSGIFILLWIPCRNYSTTRTRK